MSQPSNSEEKAALSSAQELTSSLLERNQTLEARLAELERHLAPPRQME